MGDVTSRYEFSKDDETGVSVCAVTVALAFDGDSPGDADILKAIDHLLSSIPGANSVEKGISRKDTMVAKWKAFRELG